MPVYSSKRPVRLTTDSDDEKYMLEHLTHFFNTVTYNVINGFSQEDKERCFRLLTEHENLITNLYGAAALNSKTFLPVALRNGVDNPLIREYKLWLDKQ